MARAVWKGGIEFGLVFIPVSLYPGVRANELDFDYLDRRDFSPVGYERVNKTTGKRVEWDDIVKGYQFEKGRYAVMGEEDFRLANPKATQTVEILRFVDAASVDPLYLDTPYRLAPGRRGEKGYLLLRETLRKAKKIGIAQVVIRTRQHLAAVIPVGDALVLETLRYADELLALDEFALPSSPAIRPTAREFDMARRLVEEMSGPWNPREYADTYRQDLLDRIEAKVAAGQTELIPEADGSRSTKSAQVIDLMAALQQSLAAGKRKPAAVLKSTASRGSAKRRSAQPAVSVAKVGKRPASKRSAAPSPDAVRRKRA